MISLRLDPELESKIDSTAKSLGISKSELLRKSINTYLESLPKANAWELGKQYFGKYSSGRGNLAQDRKKLLKEKLKAKRDAGNPD